MQARREAQARQRAASSKGAAVNKTVGPTLKIKTLKIKKMMRELRHSFLAKAVVVISMLLLLPLVGSAANDLAAITGRVHDSSGSPVVGALVIVAAASPIIPERVALTTNDGSFSIPNLFAGQYTVKVSMPQFLPALKQGIQLNAGGTAVLTVNLQNAMDIVRRAVSRERAKSDDIVWTLRSSRTTQPVLRIADNPQSREPKVTSGPDYSGYFQVYSKSVDTASGTTQGVGSQFSVTVPLDTNSHVTLRGQYNEAPMQPRGFGASYDFVPRIHHKTEIGMDVRQGALFADPLDLSREVQVKYGDDFQWSAHFVINYGAEAGRAGTIAGTSYLRPRFSASWVPDARTTFTFGMSSQAPSAPDDPIRGREYFDRTLYIPPALEHYSHSEAGVTRIVSENVEVSAAVFHDRTDTEALFSSPRPGRPGIVILDTTHLPSQGLRLHVNRQFRNFEAGIGYTAATGVGMDADSSAGSLQEQLVRRRFHVVAARFKARLDTTQTEITTVYRWNSELSAVRLDPYQRLDEYNDTTLSLSIAQNLPSWRMFPGRVQAIVDARNLLDQCLGSRSNQFGQYPRLVKGGISIRF
jgi:hypothetical protein